MKHSVLQTPRRAPSPASHGGRPKETPPPSKYRPKIVPKRLSCDFSAVPEDILSEFHDLLESSPEESITVVDPPEVHKVADEIIMDFTDQINLLESKYQKAVKDLYTQLTPVQLLHIACHPNRPTFLDHVLNITDKWVELHGGCAAYDDPAIVLGIESIDGKSYMLIGHRKGRNTKEHIQRNFGMLTPHGYWKTLHMMKYADHHGFPIITFIDTPGAFSDLRSEELGQGKAIAFNLRAMFGVKIPIVTVVIGEGGSGGALAIGCANKLYMLENSVFYVASPEACAAILWKTSQEAPKELGGMDKDSLLNMQHMKFWVLGGFVEGEHVEPEIKLNMKKKEADVPQVTADIC
ncbi:acetyl-coenzyme A carboxylase carboxyl transferase subunit alpha, chloroplastic-like [Musa acuminata AAA Group]|uniref:acetyl-coenzyme A carboxylase carboxyl transferase subunit alpha, chloroplastic-like n=1 Tax=Musa acuminata AAA Group TaxID=214697 RepID=UPI0031D8B06D